MNSILKRINSPDDLKRIAPEDLGLLSCEMRDVIVETVSRNGGHLASSLGAVELAIALHRVFDSPRDRIIWDVGHQCYAHKLLTGRREEFHTLRQHDGLSGFPDPFESGHDPFSAGHAGNSISAAAGMTIGRDLAQRDFVAIAVIGDGSLGSGMALEAINHAGHLGLKFIIILNDNGMSISPSIGSLSRLLSRAREGFPGAPPVGSPRPYAVDAFCGDLGFTYVGPLDGHNISELETALRGVKAGIERTALVHVITTKGKGHAPSECDAVAAHGVSPKTTGKAPVGLSYSKAFSAALCRLMAADERVVAITAAMIDGTGLAEAARQFPGRVFDVGICEQHAVTMAAGLATQGFIPVVAVYSTFLQRAYDQIINDVCLLNLPVVFAVDRAGIVGDDGKTHQGAFDVSYMRSIPNMVVSAPGNEAELPDLLFTAVCAGCPVTVRYPRGTGSGAPLAAAPKALTIGKGELLRKGGDAAILAFGSTVHASLAAAELLADNDIDCAVVNARFAKPLDEELILGLARETERIITVEDNVLPGGFGSAVVELLARESIMVRIECIGLPDRFIEHGPRDALRSACGLDADGIVSRVRNSFPELVFDVYGKKMEHTG